MFYLLLLNVTFVRIRPAVADGCLLLFLLHRSEEQGYQLSGHDGVMSGGEGVWSHHGGDGELVNKGLEGSDQSDQQWN